MDFVGAALRRERGAERPHDCSSAADIAGAALRPYRDARPLPQAAPTGPQAATFHRTTPAMPSTCKDKCNRSSEKGFASATFPCTIAPLFSG
ncbi:hypothetical protein CBP05_10360 [Pseudomonas putida]|nr:hypothetical protein CBP05_10360 [Pseudomonas putida]OUS89372.1 hypothetical protein CBP06_08455 [Pseudomonas putida]